MLVQLPCASSGGSSTFIVDVPAGDAVCAAAAYDDPPTAQCHTQNHIHVVERAAAVPGLVSKQSGPSPYGTADAAVPAAASVVGGVTIFLASRANIRTSIAKGIQTLLRLPRSLYHLSKPSYCLIYSDIATKITFVSLQTYEAIFIENMSQSRYIFGNTIYFVLEITLVDQYLTALI